MRSLALLQAAEASAISRRDAARFALGYVFALRRSEFVTCLEQQGTGDGVPRITAKTIEVTFREVEDEFG